MTRLGDAFEFVHSSRDTCRDLAETLFGIHQALTAPSGFPRDAVLSISQHIAGRAHVNAPIRTGLLRSQIRASRPAYRQDTWNAVIYVNNVRYALVMHEALLPYGDNPMASPDGGNARFFNLGERSAYQPGTPEGGVGGKYISRIANYHSEQYFSRFAAGVDILFRTGRNPGPLNLQPGYFIVNQ